MNKGIMKKLGFEDKINAIIEGKCPTCGRKINFDSFRNDISRREFGVSGLCQKCQDNYFGED